MFGKCFKGFGKFSEDLEKFDFLVKPGPGMPLKWVRESEKYLFLGMA